MYFQDSKHTKKLIACPFLNQANKFVCWCPLICGSHLPITTNYIYMLLLLLLGGHIFWPKQQTACCGRRSLKRGDCSWLLVCQRKLHKRITIAPAIVFILEFLVVVGQFKQTVESSSSSESWPQRNDAGAFEAPGRK